MARSLMILAACGLLWASLGATSSAQGVSGVGSARGGSRGPSRPEYARLRGRPTVSPYLNLLRGGSTPLNYYNLVRPQVEQYRGFATQGYEINRLDREVADQQGAINQAIRQQAPVRVTGHPSVFFDYTHYFPGSPRGAVQGAAPQ